ncbi:glycosyltransferase family 4 protein [Helicobacter apodemus]|uniref:WalR protein n=1 Tax=Helicobacter apodemus TaxID=135569 RepID=A0A2U8FDJ5_9HELI|nr:glycosyltransferase family 4 protein [Helicobacter apodemus]AWI34330.1 WalR protein [Helicobacter apodemus]
MGIKVLHTEWSNGYGGQEIRILLEMQVMRNLGVECALACRENAEILNKSQNLGFETFTLPFRRKTDILSIWQLKRLLKHYDILNTHSGIDTWCGGLASIGSGKKFIRTRHLSTPIHPSRLNFINNLADFIITTGESVREAMIRDNHIKPEKIASIPTGIDVRTFQKSLYDKETLKESYKIPKNKIIIGNLGVMRYAKRQDIFIQVAREIHKKYPHTYFIIGGSGDSFPYLEGLIKGGEGGENAEAYIKLLGYIEKPAEFLAMLDIFMLTSEKEGVPQSLMQALLMEIPSIASNVGSIKDLYHNKNFLLIPKPTLETFSQALKELLDNPHCIEINPYFILQKFSSEVMGKQILAVYEKVLNENFTH